MTDRWPDALQDFGDKLFEFECPSRGAIFWKEITAGDKK